MNTVAVKPMGKYCVQYLHVHRLSVWTLFMSLTSAVPSVKMVGNHYPYEFTVYCMKLMKDRWEGEFE